ncbi:MAG: methionyl-tRNA formyltransferase [Phycisphaerales bacterium]|jgi:methionyl-tRNA formyltransferase
MKIVYLGSGQFGIPSLDALLGSGHSIELIVTQPEKSAGRGRKTTPTAVAKWAKGNSIPFIETPDNTSPELIKKIAEAEPDLILVIAFGQKICNELINLPPKGMINVHGSLLPKYRGAAPINRAIINGDTKTGITVATITEQWDAGKILAQAETKIKDDETAGVLHDRLAELAAPVLVDAIDRIQDGTATYTEQDHNLATRAPKLKKSDGIVDFSASADSIRNKIRGLWPWPGASAVYVCKQSSKTCRVTFAMAEVVSSDSSSAHSPGTVDEQLNIICGRDALKITKIKPAGRSLMRFSDFINGYNTKPGDEFVKIEQ